MNQHEWDAAFRRSMREQSFEYEAVHWPLAQAQLARQQSRKKPFWLFGTLLLMGLSAAGGWWYLAERPGLDTRSVATQADLPTGSLQQTAPFEPESPQPAEQHTKATHTFENQASETEAVVAEPNQAATTVQSPPSLSASSQQAVPMEVHTAAAAPPADVNGTAATASVPAPLPADWLPLASSETKEAQAAEKVNRESVAVGTAEAQAPQAEATEAPLAAAAENNPVMLQPATEKAPLQAEQVQAAAIGSGGEWLFGFLLHYQPLRSTALQPALGAHVQLGRTLGPFWQIQLALGWQYRFDPTQFQSMADTSFGFGQQVRVQELHQKNAQLYQHQLLIERRFGNHRLGAGWAQSRLLGHHFERTESFYRNGVLEQSESLRLFGNRQQARWQQQLVLRYWWQLNSVLATGLQWNLPLQSGIGVPRQQHLWLNLEINLAP